MDQPNNELFQGASRKIFENARALRHRLTEAEGLLWEKLRNRKLNGYKFRRQHPLDQYVADFYCPDKKLVIELDGDIHEGPESLQYDQARTRQLDALGIRVIRFKNEEITTDIFAVLQQIRKQMASLP